MRPAFPKWLAEWSVSVQASDWHGLGDVRVNYPAADSVRQQAKRVLRSLFGENRTAARDYKAVLVPLIAEFEKSRFDIAQGITAGDIFKHCSPSGA